MSIVAFQGAALYNEPTGRMATYFGGVDTVTALAFPHLDDVLQFL